MKTRRIASLAFATLVASLLPAATVTAAASCGPAQHRGGEWRSVYHDLSNTAHQPREKVIGADNLASLTPAWRFSAAEAGADGASAFQSVPIVADGCVYVGSSSGWVFSLNADTGKLVWKTKLKGFVLGLAAEYGLIYAFPSEGKAGPHAVALDQDTGEIVWQTERLARPEFKDGTNEGTTLHASPVVFDGMVFAPLSRGIGAHRVPLYLLDAFTGETIKRFYGITEKEKKAGYGGIGIWATAVVDTENGYLYAGTADSEAFKKQHRFNQAIVKIDVDRRRTTFGEFVDAYQGVDERFVDDTVPGFERNPLCEMFGGPDDPLGGTSPSSSNSCLELDLDFGASPTLFENAEGQKMIAEQQKAGVYHVVHADTMDRAWMRVLSPPSPLGNASTGTWDGKSLSVTSNGGGAYSFDTYGFPNWVSHNGADAARYQPTTSANGVLYTQTNAGVLVARDSATGVVLLQRPMSVDADGSACVSLGGGIAIARNTIYSQCDISGWLIAYRTGE